MTNNITHILHISSPLSFFQGEGQGVRSIFTNFHPHSLHLVTPLFWRGAGGEAIFTNFHPHTSRLVTPLLFSRRGAGGEVYIKAILSYETKTKIIFAPYPTHRVLHPFHVVFRFIYCRRFTRHPLVA